MIMLAQSQSLPYIDEVLQATRAGGWPKCSNTQTLDHIESLNNNYYVVELV